MFNKTPLNYQLTLLQWGFQLRRPPSTAVPKTCWQWGTQFPARKHIHGKSITKKKRELNKSVSQAINYPGACRHCSQTLFCFSPFFNVANRRIFVRMARPTTRCYGNKSSMLSHSTLEHLLLFHRQLNRIIRSRTHDVRYALRLSK